MNSIDTMKKLIGKKCTVEFDMPTLEWPIEGYPAFVDIISVDMPMIEMKSTHYYKSLWVNVSQIAIIKEST